MDSAIEAVAELFEQGHAEAVIELCEYALTRVEKTLEQVDDSDGYMSLLLDPLQELPLAACNKAKPDPEALAERLFNWELTGDWDTFHGAAQTYSRLLGRRGAQRYRELAEVQWAGVKPLKSGENDPARYGKRYRITRIMQGLAEQTGDIEALVAIKQRDPDMHQTRRGNQWYFGMKAHIGVDSKTKLIHSVAVTPANVHVSKILEDLLHGDETRVWGDSAYTGQKDVIKLCVPEAKDLTQKKRSRNRALTHEEKSSNREKSRIRSRVEHVFGILKGQFGYRKVRYRGLDNNVHAVFTKCALENLVIAKRQLLAF